MPTSRATRVTSSANDESWSTIVFTVSLSSRISPCAATVIFCDRSPRATAVATWAMLRTWPVRFAAMKFTASVRSFQVPATPGTAAWPPSLPSVPTARATVMTCSAKTRSVSVSELMVSASSATSPLAETVIFWDRSPCGDRRGHLGDRPHLAGQVGGHGVHRVGQVAPGAGDAAHVGLAAELALGAHLAGHPGHLVGERRELVHHRVHGAADAQELTAQRPAVDLAGHVLGQVALGHGHDHAGDLGGRPAQVVDERVDRAHAVGPGALVALLVEPLGEPALAARRPG